MKLKTVVLTEAELKIITDALLARTASVEHDKGAKRKLNKLLDKLNERRGV